MLEQEKNLEFHLQDFSMIGWNNPSAASSETTMIQSPGREYMTGRIPAPKTTINVVDLKKQLGMRKLSKTGNKKELIERLVQTIKNSVGNADTTSGEPSGTNCTSLPNNRSE